MWYATLLLLLLLSLSIAYVESYLQKIRSSPTVEQHFVLWVGMEKKTRQHQTKLDDVCRRSSSDDKQELWAAFPLFFMMIVIIMLRYFFVVTLMAVLWIGYCCWVIVVIASMLRCCLCCCARIIRSFWVRGWWGRGDREPTWTPNPSYWIIGHFLAICSLLVFMYESAYNHKMFHMMISAYNLYINT